MGGAVNMVAAYDVSDGNVRRKILKMLRSWRIDGQKSVHECLLTTDQARDLFDRLCKPLDPETDLLIMARLEPRRKTLYRGVGEPAAPNNLRHIG